MERYNRQYRFKDLGEEAQKRLLSSSVLIAGSGGLGTHIATSLAGAGVGHLRLVDFDTVDMTNLARQILFTEQDAREARPKAQAAANRLRQLNSEIVIEPIVEKITPETMPGLASGVDLILDATDNFEARFVINDYAVSTRTPWVYAGVVESIASTMFIDHQNNGPCLRCLVPALPDPEETPTCATVGVLEPAIALVSAWQSTQAIKYLSGKAEQILRGITTMDIWAGTVRTIPVERSESCPVCGA